MLNINPKKLIPVKVEDITFMLVPPLGAVEDDFFSTYNGVSKFISGGAKIEDAELVKQAKAVLRPFMKSYIKEWHCSNPDNVLPECTPENIEQGLNLKTSIEIFTQYGEHWGMEKKDQKN